MTLEQFSLLPTRRDDETAPLCRFKLSAGSLLELGEAVGTEVGQSVPLQPSPEELDWIEFGRIGRQKMQLDRAVGGSNVFTHQLTAMWSGAVPYHKQPACEVSQYGFEELDHLLFGDAAFVQAKAHTVEVHAGDERELMPIEVKLHHWRLPFECPGSHSRWSLRDTGFVDEHDQSSLASGVFFSSGQVRLRQRSIATSSRSRARRSGFWLEKPSCPSKRHTWT